MFAYPSSSSNQPVQFYSTKRMASPLDHHQNSEIKITETTDRKAPMNTKLVLKKPIQVLINEGLFSKKLPENANIKAYDEQTDIFRHTTDEKWKTYGVSSKKSSNVSSKFDEENNGLFQRTTETKWKAFAVSSNLANNSVVPTSSTRSRIEELVNDSKQLISQGSKMLFEEKTDKKERSLFNQSKYQENSVNKTAVKEFRRVENSEDVTPKKKDAFKEFQRLEGKLKELEGKIKVLKTKRIEYTANNCHSTVYNPTTSEQRPYSSQDRMTKDSPPLEYSSLLQNVVTQVQPHTILPKNNIVNPKVNEKFQSGKQPVIQYERSPLLKRYDDQRYYIDSVQKAYYNPTLPDRESWVDHFWQTMQCISFVKGIEQPGSVEVRKKLLTLPKRSIYWRKKTIIFDLDETLVHCNESPDMPCDVMLKINFGKGCELDAGINVRPHLRECLKELAQHFELMVFTASHESYANCVVDHIDPNHEFIQHRLSREQCFLTNDGIFIKDLRVIGNRILDEVLIVDNAAYSFGFQLDNGVPILPFYNDKNDQELVKLKDYLINLKDCPDIRKKNKEYFNLDRYAEFKEPLELLSSLYKVIS